MADLTAALLLTDSFQTVTTKGVRLEFMGLNNTHTAEVVVTIADGRGYPLHSEAIGYATGGGGKLADLQPRLSTAPLPMRMACTSPNLQGPARFQGTFTVYGLTTWPPEP